ncbi:ABC transporter permease [Catellatospora chokoriensis]|uniref:ABC-2 type transporter transmembrane domain-containing protein n=1 Tax=Catellatospora chokoriensis TaxID=310353 RepID=A0A8J3JVK9_9ACTN|nr:ABC transporter permease [Catellatospora chokoriensis]GIF87668.1 hypothetical protein Cch02nite_11120 [Catellatospora chokoriensis]
MADSVGGFRAGASYQWMLFRAKPSSVGILIGIPFTTAVLLSIVRVAHREDLAGAAVLAPALASLWSVTLELGGQCVVADRGLGMLDLVLAGPASFLRYLWGRVTVTCAIGLIGFGEAWIIGVGAFGARPAIPHPGWFAACLCATALATVPTAALLAGVLALGRSSGAAANFLNYPLYVLGGIFTPVALLPDGVYPISRAFYLSWAADLARACLRPEELSSPASSLTWVLGLGTATAVVGGLLLAGITRRLRRTGRVSW